MRMIRLFVFWMALVLAGGAMIVGGSGYAAEKETVVERDYSKVRTGPAPAQQTVAEMMAKSDGCYSCHVKADAPTMHATPAVRLGCVDCHGGDASMRGNSNRWKSWIQTVSPDFAQPSTASAKRRLTAS